jgi:hypothetical protein
MSWETRNSRIIILTLLLVLMSSCAALNIKPPGPDAQTILILPFTAKNTSGSPYGYYYRYEIIKKGDVESKYEANFTLPKANDFLVIDTLTPGTYFVSQITTHQVGTGRRDYDDTPDARYDEIKLVAGKITIFQNSINIIQKPYGTGGSWVSNYQISLIDREQRAEILGKLEKLENIDKWTVLDMHVKPPEPAGFRKYQTTHLNEFRAFAISTSSGRWGRSWFSDTPKQAMDEALNYCEKTGEECTIYALGDTIVLKMSPAELVAAAEKYYFLVSPAMAQMNEDLLRGERLSSQEISDYLSNTQVEGTTANFMQYKGVWQSIGEMKAVAVRLGNIERAQNDVGTWTVEDGKLCRQWEHWLGGRNECLIVTKDGNTLRAYDVHGNDIEVLEIIDQN